MHGVGYSWYSRALDFAQTIVDDLTFKQEKLGRRPKRGILVGKKKMKIKNNLGLIKIQDPLLQKHVDYRYPWTMTVRGKAIRRDTHVLNAGISAGKELVIFKGVTGKGTKKRLFIGNEKK